MIANLNGVVKEVGRDREARSRAAARDLVGDTRESREMVNGGTNEIGGVMFRQLPEYLVGLRPINMWLC